ncbi:MAG TPA: DNA recombination protein RmuC [Solirubrobacteraceae bacterium]|jgi:DNA recombination protein RmuC|nr:DNA recombination protein RmuC [Solirubrobacteraceae bacterium]
MSAVWLIVGLFVGAGVTALVMRERIRALRDGQHQMSDSFKAMSAEALDASVRQLTELAKSQLQSSQAEAKGELEKRKQAVEQMVRPLQQQLEILNRERVKTGAQLESQIRMLSDAQEKLRTETGALVTALRKPNTRGQWGQMQLRKVVELAGMVRHCDFTEQASFDGDEQVLRPDMVVNLPGGKHVIVDAKAPLQGILDAYEAPDERTRAQHLQAHARLLRRHVKQLSDKAYWAGMDSAPDFVVLFLPGEHLYGAALDADPELIEDAMARRVLIATPTTLLALLHTVGYGWQQERVAESAQAISELGRELHGRLAKLSSLIATLGSRLNSTVKAYNETVGSYEARVLPSARRFAEHGAVGSSADIGTVEQITHSARDVRLAPDDEHAVDSVDALDRPRALFDDAAGGVPARHLRAADLRD